MWRLTLADGREVVLKVGPPPDLKLLTYERHLLRTEAMVYRLAAPTSLPLPALLHARFDDHLLGGDFLILSALDGLPWNRASFSDTEQADLRFQLGRHLVLLHSIPGDGVFGYPYAGLVGRTWREAFLTMMSAILDDAVHYATRLPSAVPEIARLVQDNAYALDEIVTPSLVHFDVWPGNVFVSQENGRPTIQALIDHERAFWGDPLADFITPTIFEELQDDDPLLAGYRDAGGEVLLTDAARIRLALYRVYLCLIILVEDGPRQYPEESYAPIRDLTIRSMTRALHYLDTARQASGNGASP